MLLATPTCLAAVLLAPPTCLAVLLTPPTCLAVLLAPSWFSPDPQPFQTFGNGYGLARQELRLWGRVLVEIGLLLVEEVEEGGECTDREREEESKRNGVGVVLKEEFVRSVLEVKRVSDRVMSLKLEIEGVMLNVVSRAPQVGCELEEKERFWSELDEVMESIPTGEKVVIGADFNGHVGEGNRGDEEVMGKFGVKERNLEGQMVVDYTKRMNMAVVNTYFQKREEHRVT
ncbi:hypothetical protein QTP86_030709 [Hemibagrus guttatus]|nr:hypothetical protein QTP86_030709 [Hemibagrus guttatus]